MAGIDHTHNSQLAVCSEATCEKTSPQAMAPLYRPNMVPSRVDNWFSRDMGCPLAAGLSVFLQGTHARTSLAGIDGTSLVVA